MHWFYKMLWEVQILILLLIQGQVVLINYKALCIYTRHECSKCWITNGGEVCKVLLPSVSRQSKSLMCAWLGIINPLDSLNHTNLLRNKVSRAYASFFYCTHQIISEISVKCLNIIPFSRFGMAFTLFNVLTDKLLHWSSPCTQRPGFFCVSSLHCGAVREMVIALWFST